MSPDMVICECCCKTATFRHSSSFWKSVTIGQPPNFLMDQQLDMSHGIQYNLKITENRKMMVSVYGYDNYDSYGYVAGMDLLPTAGIL